MMSVSFGVEFEFDYVREDNQRVVLQGSTPVYVHDSWGYQADPTASSELRSPVFTSLEQFVSECNSQFGGLLSREARIIPYMCNDRGRSLGQHMHVGLADRRLAVQTKRRIAKAVFGFYPFLASLHAQPIPSHRGLTTMYARSMLYYESPIATDHYAEISDSHVGTVEFRLFDSNIPQASLTCAWLTTELAKKALRGRSREASEDLNLRAYDGERTTALRHGLVGLDVTGYLRRLKRTLGNIEVPNVTCVREALYLAARYRLNFYGVWQYVDAKPYDYMRVQLSDCSRFLENLLRLDYVRHRDKLATWIVEAQQVENLDQLIGLSIAVDRSLTSQLTGMAEERLEREPSAVRALSVNVVRSLGRSQVRECIERLNVRICRINELRTLSAQNVAEAISSLVNMHGEGFTNGLSASDVLTSNFRYYVFVAVDPHNGFEQICGAIAVHVRGGEIRSLVVDRRFRRLGIANSLLVYVLNVLREASTERAFAWVRRDNNASLRLFEGLGFTVREQNERSVLMVKEFRSG